jgi:hypothetical protein
MSSVQISQTIEKADKVSPAIRNARKLIPKPRGPHKPVGLPWPLQIADKEEEFIEALYDLRSAEDELASSENILGKMDYPKRAAVGRIKKDIAEIQMEILDLRSESIR